jgi:malonate decarboxylase delta subunit
VERVLRTANASWNLHGSRGIRRVWDAVVADFIERRSPGAELSINDGGLAGWVSLRLAQAVRSIAEAR